MKEIIDIENWPRREYFDWYGCMDNPYFAMTADIDVTQVYRYAKAAGDSFYFRYLHAILRAVNALEECRYRIEQGKIVRFDRIHLSPTVPHHDGSFGFGFFAYDPDYSVFAASARADTQRVQTGSGLMPHPEHAGRIDTIYATALPWVSFTGFAHARNWGDSSGVMSIATGKVFSRDGHLLMPLQIQCHHGFVDGRHMGRLYALIQEYLDQDFC